MFNVSALLLDDPLKPATPLTNGAINDGVRTVRCDVRPPNSPDLIPVDYAVRGALRQIVYQGQRFTTINQLKQVIVSELGKLSQRFIAPLVSGGAGLSSSSSSKADTLNI